ncbi:stalk domain-containing protein [Paenibacillus sp. GP183]|uniref:stalk domain-containing protein n=1 Tax=Paenibacillus sp. GP183 TaxID=1882751 RepID=UPI00089C7696|nr:stalk domain-containing protein [Paenibacillus sp. GP183]SEC64960.1 Copper amine oxidase N-terminal domain-containing protein [Paenibacillus sp. GP183]
MKKFNIRILVAAVVIGLSFTAGVYAQDVLQKVEAYLRPDFKVFVNGKPVVLTSPPLIYDNNSYLPLKSIAQYLDAQVNWDNEAKAIHVNSRIYSDQLSDKVTDVITMMSASSQTLQYLGSTYTILTIYNAQGKIHYRLSDAHKMGIDTKGLTISKEKYTEDLFVSEEELKKAWKETPKPNYTYDYTNPIPMTGITDKKKIDALNTFVNSVKSYAISDKYYYTLPVLIEPRKEENQFIYWCTVNGKFARYDITLIPYEQLYNRPVDPNGQQYLPSGYTFKQIIPDQPNHY